MRPVKRTFSLKFLIAALAIASVLTWWVTHDRTATLTLSKYQSEEFKIDESTFRYAVESIPTRERPRSLRYENPDLNWLKKCLSVETDPRTGVIVLSISSNRGTKSQLLALLREIATYAQPPTIMALSGLSSYYKTLDERIADAVQVVDELYARENSQIDDSQRQLDPGE